MAHSDEAAAERFRHIVVPHLADALSLARWLTGNGFDAEDVVQEACVRAFSAIQSYDGRGERAWLLSIVRNTCFTWLAKNRSRNLVLMGTPAELSEAQGAIHEDLALDPEADLIRKADVTLIEAAISSLPQPYREVLVLHDINDLSYKEIAAMMSIPIGTVMSRLSRARKQLAAQLGQATQ
ncbi:RNA polymerase subunit sigma [Methylovirgula ligni]|uniref:RNA polymerase sigma factor n=1 Tax=Methylovirgula ligni TaxID=569860 RepID=A0A3D9YQ94_9HYPH|nr:sigma-70 family RNA polymerase sigma factor [Methylovirgula ligni]QAY94886.1 RNA polymerase subunit sigma [Methylovirgula ligni]REF84675.1 RNA polymerase sigma-70 factor (ECF subfamily) [Methylovirgula ligni]